MNKKAQGFSTSKLLELILLLVGMVIIIYALVSYDIFSGVNFLPQFTPPESSEETIDAPDVQVQKTICGDATYIGQIKAPEEGIEIGGIKFGAAQYIYTAYGQRTPFYWDGDEKTGKIIADVSGKDKIIGEVIKGHVSISPVAYKVLETDYLVRGDKDGLGFLSFLIRLNESEYTFGNYLCKSKPNKPEIFEKDDVPEEYIKLVPVEDFKFSVHSGYFGFPGKLFSYDWATSYYLGTIPDYASIYGNSYSVKTISFNLAKKENTFLLHSSFQISEDAPVTREIIAVILSDGSVWVPRYGEGHRVWSDIVQSFAHTPPTVYIKVQKISRKANYFIDKPFDYEIVPGSEIEESEDYSYLYKSNLKISESEFNYMMNQLKK